ncbi:hypothetical protein [Streptococcus zhangguiae]|uniref:Uncharacterized protein n=1 Tax=Streptococcus zhangguiae TaxID=2664091 RepID=A0A6I4RHC3_9STRE|nr:hypothetical protein [Streptococcus sp. zg-70]MWV55911.1 hypothetical protein [Streptococcus sp. zg-70]
MIVYHSIQIDMGISSTGKNLQFNIGEGGTFEILLPNPNNPEKSFMTRRFFHHFIEDSRVKEKVKYIFGKDQKSIESALQILKDFLDSPKSTISRVPKDKL